MDKALAAALDYIPLWLAYQVEHSRQPGCAIAIAHHGKPVYEGAFGMADIKSGAKLTPAHRFRVASHSKSFAAAGIMVLAGKGKLLLDDPAGLHVQGLDKAVARVTIAELLSHSAGLIRDGLDSAFWYSTRRAITRDELKAELKGADTIPANTRFKYSNHGFGLVGLIVEAASGEPYRAFIEREVMAAAGLRETQADGPLKRGLPLAQGYSAQWPLGERLAFKPNEPTHAIAPAGGTISTARDLASFYAQLDPAAKASFLPVAARREMTRLHREVPDMAVPRQYGLGLILGETAGWRFFGHSGGYPGYITRTCVYPAQGLSISVLTNCIDGWAHVWLDGAMNVIQTLARHGAPSRRTASWTGRWCAHWAAGDYVPVRDRVLVASPALAAAPFTDASEITVTGRDTGVISRANGFGSHGERVKRVRDAKGKVVEMWFAGGRMLPEAALKREMRKKLG